MSPLLHRLTRCHPPQLFELQLVRTESLREQRWSAGLAPHEAEESATLEVNNAISLTVTYLFTNH